MSDNTGKAKDWALEKRFEDIDPLLEFLKDYMSYAGGFEIWVGWCPQAELVDDHEPWLLKMKNYFTREEMEEAFEDMNIEDAEGQVL